MKLMVIFCLGVAAWAQAAPDAPKILDALDVRPGTTVCEIGAGSGEMSLVAARRVGANGRVYSSELGEERLKKLRDKVSSSGLTHITVVEAAAARTNFPEGGCDAIFMNDVYHHFHDPAAMNRSIAASLKPGGRVAISDFSPRTGGEASTPSKRGEDGRHGVSAESVLREMKEAGFEPSAPKQAAQRWFLLVFARATT